MNEKIEFEKFLNKILSQAIELLNAQGASIFLIEGDKLVLRATTSDNINNDLYSSVYYHSGEGITGKIFSDGMSIRLIRPESLWKSKYDEVEHQKLQVRSFLGVPIFSEKETIGVLRCTNKNNDDGFTDQDMRMLEVFAKTAAAAIEARQELLLATTAPYAFVLIPFHSMFHDIYELGIKEVTSALGFRCNKVDEIEFNDSILNQIYRGIQSADIIIAEMTGRNPNVFYEVGYAHALQKEVILLTKDASDIPFDLKGHNHIVYEGQITLLRERLNSRLKKWLDEF